MVIDFGGMEEKYRFKYSSGFTVKLHAGSVLPPARNFGGHFSETRLLKVFLIVNLIVNSHLERRKIKLNIWVNSKFLVICLPQMHNEKISQSRPESRLVFACLSMACRMSTIHGLGELSSL